MQAALLARALTAYTIELGFLGTHVLNGGFYSLPYDVLNDFAPISPLVTLPTVLLARKSIPAKNLDEWIVWLKANPNKASVGLIAVGPRLLAAVFQKETGTQFATVSYRGVAPGVQDLMAGQIDMFLSSPDMLPLVRAGTIKAFAVALDGGARYCYGKRDWTASAFMVRLVRAFCPVGYAK